MRPQGPGQQPQERVSLAGRQRRPGAQLARGPVPVPPLLLEGLQARLERPLQQERVRPAQEPRWSLPVQRELERASRRSPGLRR